MDKDEKILFLVSKDHTDGVPVVALGIPTRAWEYMKDGKTHTFDLRKTGVPVKLLLFGTKDHESAMKLLETLATEAGITVDDQRGKDFSL